MVVAFQHVVWSEDEKPSEPESTEPTPVLIPALPNDDCSSFYDRLLQLPDNRCDPNPVFNFNQQNNGMGQGNAAARSPLSPQPAASDASVSQLAFAPNIIGDFFGGGVGTTVAVQPPSFLVTPTPITTTFVGQNVLIPVGANSPLILNPGGFYERPVIAGNLSGISFNPVITGPLTVGTPVNTPFAAFTFTSLDDAETVGDLLNGNQLQLDDGGAGRVTALQTFYLLTKPGLQAQTNAFAVANSVTGTGTFTPIGGEDFTVSNGVAVQTVDNVPNGVDGLPGYPGIIQDESTGNTTDENSIVSNSDVEFTVVDLGDPDDDDDDIIVIFTPTPDEFDFTQDVEYTPGDWLFTPDPYTVTPPAYQIFIPSGDIAAAPGANVGRLKLTENTSPLPRDRVYVNYSYFNNTPLFQGGVDVNRVTPGVEKTFWNGQASFEIRTPFASTLDNDIFNESGITNTSAAQFGNITMYLKALLWSNETLAVSSGLGATVPTASDFTLRDSLTGQPLVNVDNESVHLLPFVGFLAAPSERLFLQGFAQFDVDTNGNPVSATSFAQGLPTGNMFELDRGYDKTFAFISLSAGYWMYLNENPGGLITGVAPMIEYHLNQSLSDGDHIQGVAGNTAWDFGAPTSFSQSNAVVGLTTVLRNQATLTLGYASPLGGGDQQFDGEMRVLFNWYFGGPVNRLARVQF